MKKTLFIASLLTIALGINPAFAGHFHDNSRQDGPRKHQPKMGKVLKHMDELLDLSTTQKVEVLKIMISKREKFEALRKDMKDVRQELFKASRESEINEKTIRSLAKKQAGIRAEITINRILAKKAIRSILTPEQRELMDLSRPTMHRSGKRHASPDYANKPKPSMGK